MAGGRPRTETVTRRDCVVSVRLSEAERAELDARAIAAALPLPDFARVALVSAKTPRRRASSAATLTPAELAQLDQIGRELRAIGNNLNQIARAVNAALPKPINDDLQAGVAELAATRAQLDTIFLRWLK